MARGGVRQGTPGKSYSNRSDLNASRQPVQSVKGQAYGKRKAQEDAQQAVPLPKVTPGSFGPIDRPTDNPQEPVTAGLPFGPGSGPETLMAPQMGDGEYENARIKLMALYRKSPSNALLAVIEHLEQTGEM